MSASKNQSGNQMIAGAVLYTTLIIRLLKGKFLSQQVWTLNSLT